MKRPIHELLTILRDNARVEHNMIQEGLCLEVQYLSYTSHMITFLEAIALMGYIRKNMQVIMIDSKIRSDYGWERKKWEPLLAWINEHIELTSHLNTITK